MEVRVSSVLLYLGIVFMGHSTGNTKDVAEYCQNESFKTKCGQDQVIVMTSALYGRMRFSRCIERDYGYVGQCSADVLDAADVMCSGRRSCEIEVPNSVLDSRRACPKDLKSYLETTHTCIKVMSQENRRCRAGQPHVLLAPSGLLASVLTEESGLGSADCPWMIKAQPGQKINITLFDFATTQLNGEVCHAYAILREVDPTRSITVCGSTMRERNVYTSISDTVDVRILRSPQNNNSKGKYFILKYDFIGCADPPKPLNGWVNRDGDTVTMGCMTSSDTWKLTCKRNKWEGVALNCTSDPGAAGVLGEVSWGGISIVIIIGIALAIGVVILTVGLLILKWQRRRSASKAARLQNDNPYEHGRKHSPGRSPGSPKETDPYYSTENEYAYIADVNTPTPPPLPPLPPNRAGVADTYSSQLQRFTFNTAPSNGAQAHPAVQQQSTSPPHHMMGPPPPQVPAGEFRPNLGYAPKNTNAHGGLRGDVSEQPRYEDMPPYPVQAPPPMAQQQVIQEGEDPPKYFELDPKAVKNGGDSKGTSATSRVLPPPPGRDGISYENNSVPAPRMVTNSIHDYSPSTAYDQLGPESETPAIGYGRPVAPGFLG